MAPAGLRAPTHVSAQSPIVRFPARTEYWYSASPPAVGDTIDRHGTRYVVTGCSSADECIAVTLELVAPAGIAPPQAD